MILATALCRLVNRMVDLDGWINQRGPRLDRDCTQTPARNTEMETDPGAAGSARMPAFVGFGCPLAVMDSGQRDMWSDVCIATGLAVPLQARQRLAGVPRPDSLRLALAHRSCRAPPSRDDAVDPSLQQLSTSSKCSDRWYRRA